MEKQVVKKNSAGALASLNLRADSGKGAEEIKSDDVSTPILKILHQLSPECNSRSPKFVEGAQPGMIYSNSFGKLIDGSKGMDIIVAHSQTRYPEWQEKGDSVAAPVGTHLTPPAESKEEIRGIKYRLLNGTYAVFKLKTVEKSAGDKTWHIYKPSLVKMLDVSDQTDAAIYKMGQDFQKQVSTGFNKPKYEKVEQAKSEDII